MFIVPCSGVNVDQMVAIVDRSFSQTMNRGFSLETNTLLYCRSMYVDVSCRVDSLLHVRRYINTKRVCRCSSVWVFFFYCSRYGGGLTYDQRGGKMDDFGSSTRSWWWGGKEERERDLVALRNYLYPLSLLRYIKIYTVLTVVRCDMFQLD